MVMRTSPAEVIPYWGVDLSSDARPGVPMEHDPRPVGAAHWREPERQPEKQTVLEVAGRPRVPPVFGTAQPPRGMSGLIRRAAYRIPEYRVRHWLMLLFADRVDVAEHNIARTLFPLLIPAAATGVWFANRRRRSRRRYSLGVLTPRH